MAYSDIASKQYGGIEEEIPVPCNAAYPSGYHQQQGPIGYQNLQSASVLPATVPSREREDREDTEAGNTSVEHLKAQRVALYFEALQVFCCAVLSFFFSGAQFFVG
eukprot:Em0021g892a